MDISWEDEVHRKCLEQMSSLVSSYEAGRITGQTLKIAFETIWNCLSGVLKTDDFAELIREANAYIRTVKDGPFKAVVIDDDDIIID